MSTAENTPMSDRKLAGVMQQPAQAASPVGEENKRLSIANLDRIERLNQNEDFKWFMENALMKKFQDAKKVIQSPIKPENLGIAHSLYTGFREMVTWIKESELVARRTIDPSDFRVETLQREIDAL